MGNSGVWRQLSTIWPPRPGLVIDFSAIFRGTMLHLGVGDIHI
jgi:hypothetical protein